jgi:hypothetical protein
MTTRAVRTYVRDPTSGAGINAVTVSLKKHNGGATVTSDATDANGLAELDRDAVGYPGPAYLTFTSGSTTDTHSGNVVGQIAGLLWAADLPDALALFGIGVVPGVGSELAASSAGTDMEIDVAAGMAMLKDGQPYIQEATQAVVIGTSDPSNPRIDRVVLRLTREGQTDQGKIVLAVAEGTPAGSPVAPALTQTSATWEFSLAQVSVLAGVTSIAANKVTDERYSTSLGQAYAFLYPASRTAGDVFYVTAAGKLARLAIGSTGTYLRVTGGIPAWDDISADDILAAVSDTELGYVDGVTSPIQTQLDAKQPLDADLTVIAALADPNADRILFWDDSAGSYAYLAAGTGLTITGTTIAASGTGDVVGPGSATDNAVARFDTTTGKLLQNSSATVSDAGVATATGLTGSGTASTAVAGAAMGSVSGNSATVLGSDFSGRVSLTSGTGTTTGTVYTVTFGTTRADNNFVVLIDPDPIAMDANLCVTSRATTGFVIHARSTVTATAVITVGWVVVGR